MSDDSENLVDEDEVKLPSSLGRRVSKLKSSAVKAAASRENLPSALFWSLFLSEISELRKEKTDQRVLRKLMMGIEE